jgi:hypothetical protein
MPATPDNFSLATKGREEEQEITRHVPRMNYMRAKSIDDSGLCYCHFNTSTSVFQS